MQVKEGYVGGSLSWEYQQAREAGMPRLPAPSMAGASARSSLFVKMAHRVENDLRSIPTRKLTA